MLAPEKTNFSEENCNALLAISRPEIPERILQEASAHGLQEKPEFHISVIASRNGRAITNFLSHAEGAERMREQIRDDFIQTQWKYELLDAYYLLEKFYNAEELKKSGYIDIPEHTRYTLIQEVRLDELEGYYERLARLTGISFEKPFSHTTLFSGSDYEPMKTRGIGVYSQKDLDTYLKAKI